MKSEKTGFWLMIISLVLLIGFGTLLAFRNILLLRGIDVLALSLIGIIAFGSGAFTGFVVFMANKWK